MLFVARRFNFTSRPPRFGSTTLIFAYGHISAIMCPCSIALCYYWQLCPLTSDPSWLHLGFRSALNIKALESSYQWGKVGLLNSGEAHNWPEEKKRMEEEISGQRRQWPPTVASGTTNQGNEEWGRWGRKLRPEESKPSVFGLHWPVLLFAGQQIHFQKQW